MPINVATVINNGSTVNANSYTTVSVSPVANQLMLMWVGNGKAATPDIPAVAGNGLTWVQVATVLFSTLASPTRRLTLLRAMGAVPTPGTLAISFGGLTQLSCFWALDTASGIDLSGTNGSGAIVQSNTNRVDAAASLAVALGAFSSGNNSTYAGFMVQTNNTFTEKAGYTELVDGGIGTTPIRMETEWIVSNDISPNATQAGNRNWGGIAVELKALVTGIKNSEAKGMFRGMMKRQR